ncbi:MAG: prepilin-type N-terminal cleavage/methylation domain-containing protein [Lysobacter sp.]|nr:prepilin-type N-terminal cleavage/methylation domain-containing protein [Lysobacter sp.]
MHKHPHHRNGGFSLIEVLIAIVVLATGLLAMASLQGRLSTNSADAKARSRVAALLSSVMDDQRATSYASIKNIADSCPASGTPTALQASICTAQTDGGISGLGLTQTVTTLYGLTGGGAFTTTVPAAGADYGEYKLMVLGATWKDATGADRKLSVTTITSALALDGSPTLIDNSLAGSTLTPTVHQPNPSLTAGVIPIAVGTNANGGETDTASTNPRPTLGQTLPTTTFNTLTYTQGALDSSVTSTIQKRVETTVAECGCQYSSSNPFTLKNGGLDVFLGSNSFRPTYWNGLKYVSPVSNTLVAPFSSQVSSLKGSQSDQCSIVCRDHHDAADGSDVVKYDSVTGDYSRYVLSITTTGGTTKVALKTDSKGAPIAADSSKGDTYLDAARLIRVDGLWRVATDIHAEHVGLLATQDKALGYATSPSPDSSAETAYGGKDGFVIDYMGQRLRQIMDGATAPDANAIYATHGLDVPALIQAVTTSNTYRYLHVRGLYLDTLEKPALDKLSNVRATCSSFPTCMLPYLPFNTINATQLASWSSLSGAGTTTRNKIDVTNSTTSNTDTLCDTSLKVPTQVRGCVSGKNADDGSANPYDQAIATMGKSNSAVAASLPISPYELNAANRLKDAQSFTVSGTATASEFFVDVSGNGFTLSDGTTGVFWTNDLSTSNEPKVSWTVGTSSDFCSATIGGTDTNPNPYDCVSTVALALPFNVTVGNYNQYKDVSVTYSTPAGGTGTTTRKVLVCYKVSGASVVQYPAGTPDSNYTTTTTANNPSTKDETTTVAIAGTPTPMPKSQRELMVTLAFSGYTEGALLSTDPATGVPTYDTPTTCPP